MSILLKIIPLAHNREVMCQLNSPKRQIDHYLKSTFVFFIDVLSTFDSILWLYA